MIPIWTGCSVGSPSVKLSLSEYENVDVFYLFNAVHAQGRQIYIVCVQIMNNLTRLIRRSHVL